MLLQKNEKGNYVLPAGALYFFPEDEDSGIYLKQSEEITLTPETENAELRDSDTAQAYILEDHETFRSYQINIAMRDISDEAIALFLGGESADEEFTSNAVSDEEVTIDRKGRVFRLGVDEDNPRGVRNLSDVSIDPDGEGESYEAGTDYDIDERRGTMYVPEDSAIDEEETVLASYDHGGVSVSTITADSQSRSKRGRLELHAENTRGEDKDVWLPNVQLRAEGDMSHQDREEYQQIGLLGSVMPDDEGNLIYVEGEPVETD